MSTAREVLTGSHSNTILTRQVSLSNNSPVFSSAQAQVDQLSSQFIAQASDWKSVAALMAGGLAYRLGKVGIFNLAQGHVTAVPLRMTSIAFGLANEVTAFEFTNRTLSSVSVRAGLKPAPTPHLWNWFGTGGWKEGFTSSLITFSLLKGAGHLARQENFILQQIFPATAMVLGHHAGSRLKITPAPEGTLPQQFTHALITNLQLLSGLSLAHSLTGGRLLALEKSLDLKTRAAFNEWNNFVIPSPAFQKVGASPQDAKISENGKTSPLLWMSRPKDASGQKPSGSSPPTVDSQHPPSATTQGPIDRIRQTSAAFFFPIDSEQTLKFEKDLEVLNGDPEQKLGPSDLRLALTFQAAPLLERGFDPMMVLHNTGADFLQLSELIAGSGREGFPLSVSLEISSQDYIAAALERFAVSRKTPHFSLHIRLPASHLADWAVENREGSSPHKDPFPGHDLPAERIPSLMKRALEKGAVKILVLPGTYPREVEYVSKALENAGFPSDVIVEAGGKDFWEVMALDRQETREAAARWAETLVGHSQTLKEELIESWIDLIQAFQEAPPANLRELGNWMEKQSTHFQWPLPPPELFAEIYSRLRSDSENKFPSRKGPGPDGTLLTLLIASAGITTLLSSEPAQAAVREGINSVSEAGLPGLLALGSAALFGMAFGKKNDPKIPSGKIEVEEVSSEAERRKKIEEALREAQAEEQGSLLWDKTKPPEPQAQDITLSKLESLFHEIMKGNLKAFEELNKEVAQNPQALEALSKLSQEPDVAGVIKTAALESLAAHYSYGSEKALEYLSEAAKTDEEALRILADLVSFHGDEKALRTLTELAKTHEIALEGIFDVVDGGDKRGFEALVDIAHARWEINPQDKVLTTLIFNLHVRTTQRNEDALTALYHIGHFHPLGAKYLYHYIEMFGLVPSSLGEMPPDWTEPEFLKKLYEAAQANLKSLESNLKAAKKKPGSGGGGTAMALIAGGAGLATFLSSEPVHAMVRDGVNASDSAGLFGLLTAGALALWGMAFGGKETKSEQVQRSLKEAIDRQLRRRMGVGLPAVNHEFSLTLDRQTGEVIEREFNLESRETQIHWLKISLKVDEAGNLHLAEHDRERLLWQLSRSDHPSEKRDVLEGILKLEGKFYEEESTPTTPSENQIPSEETPQKTLRDLAPTRAPSPIPSQGKFSANEPLGLRILHTLLLENPLMALSAERREEIFDYFKTLALDPETPFPPWIMDLAYQGKASGGVDAFLIPDFPRYQGNQSLRSMKVIYTDPQQLILTLQTLPGNEAVQSLLFRSEVGSLPFVSGDTVYIYLPPSQ